MIKFEVGKKYYARSVCDHDCVWTFKVIKRTAQTVTLEGGREGVKTCRISKQTSEYRGAESVCPLGQYSMAPILSADHVDETENFLVTLAEDDLTVFEMLRADGSTLARVPYTTNTLKIRDALKTLFPGCNVTFDIMEV